MNDNATNNGEKLMLKATQSSSFNYLSVLLRWKQRQGTLSREVWRAEPQPSPWAVPPSYNLDRWMMFVDVALETHESKDDIDKMKLLSFKDED